MQDIKNGATLIGRGIVTGILNKFFLSRERKLAIENRFSGLIEILDLIIMFLFGIETGAVIMLLLL